MKKHLENNDGRYVSDFPDDLLWDHKNSVILPHSGASTEEAEDAAAAMAADTIKDYLESGTIINSVNFPKTVPSENSVRFRGFIIWCMVRKHDGSGCMVH